MEHFRMSYIIDSEEGRTDFIDELERDGFRILDSDLPGTGRVDMIWDNDSSCGYLTPKGLLNVLNTKENRLIGFMDNYELPEPTRT